MDWIGIRRWLIRVWLGIACCIVGTLFFSALHTYREYENVKLREAKCQRLLERTRQEFTYKYAYLNHLEHDPDFLEWLIKQRLNYVKPEAVVYKFVDFSENIIKPSAHGTIFPATHPTSTRAH